MILTIYRLKRTKETFEFISDAQKMHRALCNLFKTSRKENNILYRIECDSSGAPCLFLQADTYPGRFEYGDVILQKNVKDVLRKSDDFIISLITAPNYHIRRNGNHYLNDTSRRIDWVERKLKERGFEVEDIREGKKVNTSFYHAPKAGGINKGGYGNVSGWQYNCRVHILDREKAEAAWCKGIGKHKAYGFGMLLIGSVL